MVGERVEQLQRRGSSLAEMAILVRVSAQTRSFEERMITLGVPYRVVGGLRFYERAEIRDAIAYMRVLHSPADDLAFERIVNVPRRGVGAAALQAMHGEARGGAERLPLYVATQRLLASGGLKGRVREAMAGLLRQFDGWREALPRDGHVAVLATMLDESGYTEMWKQDKSPEAPGRLENLRELVRAMADFETLAGFLDHVSLVMENEQNAQADRISLMTLHAAKGLEFDTVFLPGWEEGTFPNQRALDESGLQGAGGGAAARLRGHHAGAQAGRGEPRRQPAAVWQLAELHPLALPRRAARGARGARGLGGDGARAAAGGRPQRVQLRAADRAPAQDDRRLGAAGAPRPPGQAGGGRPGVPPEVRLRRDHRGGGRPGGRGVRQGGDQAPARPLRGEGVSMSGWGTGGRHATRLETVHVTVPEAAVEAYEAALLTACGTVGLFLADEARRTWRLEGVKDAGPWRGGAWRRRSR